MSKLYVFGDSYSTPGFCVDPRDSWWGLLAQDLGNKITQVKNYSWPGNNIDSIGHVMINLTSEFEDSDYIVTAIPPLQRLTMFNPEKSKEYKATLYNDQLNEQYQVDVLCHTGLAQYAVHDMDRKFVDLWNPSWIEAQVLRQILTMDCFLKQKTDHVIWLNSSVPFQARAQWPVLAELQGMIEKSANMVLHDNTYYTVNNEKIKPVDFDTYGWFGHQGAEGNQAWYNSSIKPLIEKLGWLL